MNTLPELRSFLDSPRKIVLFGHRNPDGDAIGSTLGLKRYLEPLGHEVNIVVPSDYPAFLSFLDGVDDVKVFDTHAEDCKAIMNAADLFVLMDFNSLERIDKAGELIAALPDTPRLLIDHHLDPVADIAQIMVSEPSASSTCEMVYTLIKDMGGAKRVTPHIAEPLMVGILTDTGGFTYATNAQLFRVVSELFEIGVDNEKLQTAIFNSMTEKQLRLLGHCLANRMEIIEEHNAGLITLTKRDYEQFDIRRGDTEGIVNYLLRVQGVDLAAFITEQPNITKLSLRSRGDISVQKMAAEYFKGGGHKNASGGYSHAGLRSTVSRFKEALEAGVSVG
ncbi:MAG: bifunctional oligoribonuclease/PAP phosphatase NrnA [Saprospiraceae bacterium]